MRITLYELFQVPTLKHLFKLRMVSHVLCGVLFFSGVQITLLPLIANAQAVQTTQSSPLETVLLSAVRNAKFDQVIDYGPYNEACPGANFCPDQAPYVSNMPNVDVAVIELGNNGQLIDLADVLLSRDYSTGIAVPLDGNYTASSVRWRKWDIERWDGGTFSSIDGTQITTKGWTDNPPLTAANDILSGREAAPYQFMAPYPASLFKLLVAYRIMRLVDAGELSLDQRYTYPVTRERRKIRDWMDPMITYSDNTSTQALLKLLYDRDRNLTAMNAEFRNLGLGTLQINNINSSTGGGWQPGSIHMTAMDTARLLWIIDGAIDPNQRLWQRPDGQFVTPAELTNSSRTYLKGLLADQGLNEALSTANFCSSINPPTNVKPGIPSKVPDRWIKRNQGTVTVDGIAFGQDVRPCNEIAEVLFSHKTGLTFNYGSNAGIVQSLSGQPNRHYIIAFLANLGYRYADPVFATRNSFPCYDNVGPICYTQRIPTLGQHMDCWLTSKQSTCVAAEATLSSRDSAANQGNNHQGNNQGNNQGGQPPNPPENPGQPPNNCRPENRSVDGQCFNNQGAKKRHDQTVEHGDINRNPNAERRRSQSIDHGDTQPQNLNQP